MVNTEEEFQVLLWHVRQRDPEATSEFISQFGKPLFQTVNTKMPWKLRGLFECDDFVQDVWKAFFATVLDEIQFECPKGLIQYLGRMAETKLQMANRHFFHTQKTAGSKESSLEQKALDQGKTMPSFQPGPLALAGSQDEWDRLFDLVTVRQQQILVLLRAGNSHKETAAQLHIGEKTVRREMKAIQQTARSWKDNTDPPGQG
jgi:hypothetical protein